MTNRQAAEAAEERAKAQAALTDLPEFDRQFLAKRARTYLHTKFIGTALGFALLGLAGLRVGWPPAIITLVFYAIALWRSRPRA
jgi:hypothetical protein